MLKYDASWRRLDLSMSIWESICARWKDLIGQILTPPEEQSWGGASKMVYLYSGCSQVSVFTDTLQEREACVI